MVRTVFHCIFICIFYGVDSLGSNDSKAGTFPRRHHTIAWYKSDFADGMSYLIMFYANLVLRVLEVVSCLAQENHPCLFSGLLPANFSRSAKPQTFDYTEYTLYLIYHDITSYASYGLMWLAGVTGDRYLHQF